MRYDELSNDPVLKVARDLGWLPFGFNAVSRRHFHWFLPEQDVNFSIHLFVGAGDVLTYRVGQAFTTDPENAIRWLRAARAGLSL